jgi:hypothetical protein
LVPVTSGGKIQAIDVGFQPLRKQRKTHDTIEHPVPP